jgi:hypothetical protein
MWARWPTEGHNGALLGCGVGGISAGTCGLGRVRRRLGKMGGSDTQLHAAEGERERHAAFMWARRGERVGSGSRVEFTSSAGKD